MITLRHVHIKFLMMMLNCGTIFRSKEQKCCTLEYHMSIRAGLPQGPPAAAAAEAAQ
jgi:hypothetical protein